MNPQVVENDIEVIVHRRTAGTGHLTAVMGVEDAVKFADAEIAQGRAVILEMGDESVLVRVGREIIGFVRRAVGKGKPTITTLSPMAGGQNPTAIPPMPPTLRYGGDMVAAEAPRPGRARGRPLIAPPEAELRAWNALVEHVGERSSQGMLAGGGYAIRSKLWPHMLYVVSPDIIKIINQGMQVARICILPTDGGSVWDAVLSRIQLLESGEDGEVQIFATGNLMQG